MKIGLDFDGVISDCGRLKSVVARELYGLDLPPDKFKKEIIVDEGHLTMEQYRHLLQIVYGTREKGLLMEPVEGAFESILQLQSKGHTLPVITSRGEVELQIAKEWCEIQGIVLNFVGVGPNVNKANACSGLDSYIDDDLDKLEPLVGIVPHLFLFSWGYNSHLNEGTIARRVSSWKEFLQIIESL
ncbi:MAG TPA: hypothetical protein P5274_02540 [Candidatus Paceibacterota bacterium]|nr:hypothetical protein [Candidatus Paceibacterota bacterium]